MYAKVGFLTVFFIVGLLNPSIGTSDCLRRNFNEVDAFFSSFRRTISFLFNKNVRMEQKRMDRARPRKSGIENLWADFGFQIAQQCLASGNGG